MGHSPSRTVFRYFPFLFAALLLSPAAYARGGPAWITFSLLIAGLAGIAVVTLLAFAIASLCARKGRRLRVFVITCLAWPAWSLCLFFVVPKFLCNQFFFFEYLCQHYSLGTAALLHAISAVSLWFILLFYKYRKSEELRLENAA
jgi:hypothetical protein